MPRMQVYLPDDLYDQVKRRGLPASELLQAAIRAEVRRRQLSLEADRYLEALVDKVGEPSAREVSAAKAIARRVAGHRVRKAS
jgi:post-segregation antitoxin (ccd killing protein)